MWFIHNLILCSTPNTSDSMTIISLLSHKLNIIDYLYYYRIFIDRLHFIQGIFSDDL